MSATSPKTNTSEQLTILISGASGLIGREVIRQLNGTGRGHRIRRLVRGEPQKPDEVYWAPNEGKLSPEAVDDVDIVINFSGSPLMDLPWTGETRTKIRDSRVRATRTLAAAMNAAANPPGALLNASATGFYGDRPAEQLTEESPRGAGFLADVVEEWETAAHTAPPSTRVVTFRTGIVMAKEGALGPLMHLTRLGLAGPLASGRQNWPWISLYDEAAAIVHLTSSHLRGPVNLVGPSPATAEQIMKRLAHDMHRPYWLPAPKRLLTLTLRDAAEELLLVDQNVSPTMLEADGFTWKHATVETAIDALTEKEESSE